MVAVTLLDSVPMTMAPEQIGKLQTEQTVEQQRDQQLLLDFLDILSKIEKVGCHMCARPEG